MTFPRPRQSGRLSARRAGESQEDSGWRGVGYQLHNLYTYTYYRYNVTKPRLLVQHAVSFSCTIYSCGVLNKHVIMWYFVNWSLNLDDHIYPSSIRTYPISGNILLWGTWQLKPNDLKTIYFRCLIGWGLPKMMFLSLKQMDDSMGLEENVFQCWSSGLYPPYH